MVSDNSVVIEKKRINRCPQCDFVNPPESNYCGVCGTALETVPAPPMFKPIEVSVLSEKDPEKEKTEEKKCSECGTVNPPESQFCFKCGVKIDAVPLKESEKEKTATKKCPKCGRMLNSDAKFCGFCATKLDVEPGGEICPHCKKRVPGLYEQLFCPFCGKKIQQNQSAGNNMLSDILILIASFLLIAVFFLPYISIIGYDFSILDVIGIMDSLDDLSYELGIDSGDLGGYIAIIVLVSTITAIFLVISIIQSLYRLVKGEDLKRIKRMNAAKAGYIMSLLISLVIIFAVFIYNQSLVSDTMDSLDSFVGGFLQIDLSFTPFLQMVVALGMIIFLAKQTKKK